MTLTFKKQKYIAIIVFIFYKIQFLLIYNFNITFSFFILSNILTARFFVLIWITVIMPFTISTLIILNRTNSEFAFFECLRYGSCSS